MMSLPGDAFRACVEQARNLLSIVAMAVTLLLLHPRSPLQLAVRIRPLADAGG